MQDNSQMLPNQTREEIDELAQNDPTQHESAWDTYEKLPKNEKWPYFYRHFFWPIIGWIVAVIAIIALFVTICVGSRGTKLGVAFVDMDETTSQVTALEDGFLKSNSNLKKDVIQFDNGYATETSSSSNATSGNNGLDTAISAGSVNTLIGPKSALEAEAKEGLVEPLADALTPSQLQTLTDRGAVVELTDSAGHSKAAALDLSKSSRWLDAGGADDAAIAFINADNSYVKAFVSYLFDL